jgi:hypothetical protein
MSTAAGLTQGELLSAFAASEFRNADAVRGFASLAAYQNLLELPEAGSTQVSLRDIATIAISLSAMALVFYFPASQVLLVALAAVCIGVRSSWRRFRVGKLAACRPDLAAG